MLKPISDNTGSFEYPDGYHSWTPKAKITFGRVVISDPYDSKSYPAYDPKLSSNGVSVYHSKDNTTTYKVWHDNNGKVIIEEHQTDAFKANGGYGLMPGYGGDKHLPLDLAKKTADDDFKLKPSWEASGGGEVSAFNHSAKTTTISEDGSAWSKEYSGSIMNGYAKGAADLGKIGTGNVDKAVEVKLGVDIVSGKVAYSYIEPPKVIVDPSNPDKVRVEQQEYGVSLDGSIGMGVKFDSGKELGKQFQDNFKFKPASVSLMPNYNKKEGDITDTLQTPEGLLQLRKEALETALREGITPQEARDRIITDFSGPDGRPGVQFGDLPLLTKEQRKKFEKELKSIDKQLNNTTTPGKLGSPLAGNDKPGGAKGSRSTASSKSGNSTMTVFQFEGKLQQIQINVNQLLANTQP